MTHNGPTPWLMGSSRAAGWTRVAIVLAPNLTFLTAWILRAG